MAKTQKKIKKQKKIQATKKSKKLKKKFIKDPKKNQNFDFARLLSFKLAVIWSKPNPG